MKKIIILIVMMVSNFAIAGAPVSFNFSAVPLMSFAQATYKNILQRDYVIAPELIAMDKKITVSIKSLDSEKLPAFVDNLLLTQGINSTLKNDIYYLSSVRDSVVSPGGVIALGSSAPGASAPGASALGASAPGASAPGASAPGADNPVVEKSVTNVRVYVPQNRSTDFMVTVINAAFGSSVARPAGAQIVIAGDDETIDKVIELAGSLDLAAKSVEIQASFIEVSRSSNSSRGLALVASVLGAKFGATVGPGAGSVSLKAANFTLVLDALDADGRFKQVSNSRVVGDDSEKMTLSVGDETPTISSSGKDNQGNPIQSVVYRPSGVIIDVVPRVLGSGRVALVVDGQISNFTATATGVTGSPTLIKRQVKTSLTVADGAVVILGGLDDTKSSNTNSGLAFLPAFLSGRSGSDSHTDLVLVLSATVNN